jgi:dUTP pyrophosphatase
MEINYKKINEKAKAPYKKIDIDAGFDLYATSINKTNKYIEYGTGLVFEIPEGYVGLLFPRSSVTKEDLMLKNAVGVVDASYRGEVKFRYINAVHDLVQYNVQYDEYMTNEQIKLTSVDRYLDHYEIGDRCGQIIFMEIPKIKLIEATELSDTERGTGGYGHSGKK